MGRFPAFFKHALKNGSNIIDIVPLNAKKNYSRLKNINCCMSRNFIDPQKNNMQTDENVTIIISSSVWMSLGSPGTPG